MPHPTKKLSKTSARTRAAHFALKTMQLAACEKCGASRKPHAACPSCGAYKTRTVKK